MTTYFAIVYVLSLALSYELQSTHAALLFGKQLAGTSEGAKHIQNAVTPPTAANVGLVIYFNCLATAGYGWYRYGWLVGLATIPALLLGSGINRLFVPRSDSKHFRWLIIGSMMRRYADYEKSVDRVRANAIADLRERAGFPLPEFAKPPEFGSASNSSVPPTNPS